MTHINQRRDTAENWTAGNPVLDLGEVGWERDTKKAKQGDGETPWNDLDYVLQPIGEWLQTEEAETVLLASTADSIAGETDSGLTPQEAVDARVAAAGATIFDTTATAAQRAAVNADHAAAFGRIQQKFATGLNGAYLSRSGDDYTFLLGFGSGRFGSFSLPRVAQSLNGVTYTVNCLHGCGVQIAVLTQDDGYGTYGGSGTWTHQPQSSPATGYLRLDIVVSTTASSTTIPVTSGVITSQMSGRRVVIAGAGAAGADLTTTMTYVDATHFTVGTAPSSSGTGRAAVIYPMYRFNATGGATATWVTPASTVSVAMGILTAQNGGLGKVTVTGAVAGVVAANLCQTAQAAVDSGRYANTILVANGGSLNPTDRVIDFYSGQANTFNDVRRGIAEGLAADTYTVVLTGTGYTPTGGTGSRIYVDRWAYALAATLPTDTGAQMFPAYDLYDGTHSAWEMAMECKPHSGSTWTFVGQTAHQLEDQQSLTIKINDVTVTPTDGAITPCVSAEIVRTTKLYHPDSGAALASSPLATCTYTYRWDRNQLSVTVDLVFAIETDVRTAYVMMPLISRLGAPAKIDRAALEACPDLLSMTGTGTYLGDSHSAFGWAWDSTGKVGAGMYVPDHYGLTRGYASALDGTRVEDRATSSPLTKFYFPWVGVNHTRTYQPGDRVTYAARYFAGYFADANAALAAT